MKQRTLTLGQIYREGAEALKAAGIEEAALDAWYLLEHVTGITKAFYFGHPEHELEEEQVQVYESLIGKRGRRIPLQHITGEQEFMGYTFRVNENVLVPRQDTEVLVEEVLKHLKPGMKVLDMCTGSGCIILSVLKMGKERYQTENISGTGADISEKALEVAGENAKLLETEAEFIQSDLFQNVAGKYDVIVSNPPYIRTAVIEGLQDEVRLHDPYIALDGKEDGLYFYRRIIEESVHYIRSQGMLMFEIGHDQGKEVSELMETAGYSEVSVKKDLAGLDRVVIGMYNE